MVACHNPSQIIVCCLAACRNPSAPRVCHMAACRNPSAPRVCRLAACHFPPPKLEVGTQLCRLDACHFPPYQINAFGVVALSTRIVYVYTSKKVLHYHCFTFWPNTAFSLTDPSGLFTEMKTCVYYIACHGLSVN